MAEFPALNGQSVSYATLVFPPGSVNPPHTHPRSAELLLVVNGALSIRRVRRHDQQALHPGPGHQRHVRLPQGAGWCTSSSTVGRSPPWRCRCSGARPPVSYVSVPVSVFGTGIDDPEAEGGPKQA
uniref:Cupin type-1 domain-containing protein n=1 Tax=Oryza brachyantha TaxID=4533 RepID=J3N0A6_ORYBR